MLFGLAVSGVILRTIRRLTLFRRLQPDDIFVWFALLCLSAAAGCFFNNLYILILQDAALMDPNVVVPITIPAIISSLPITDAFVCTIWTCTFAVKASFLALFRPLIRGMSRNIITYYWVVVGCTFLTWLFLLVEPFIVCPHFGLDECEPLIITFINQHQCRKVQFCSLQPDKCYPQNHYSQYMGFTILVTILDITSDFLSKSKQCWGWSTL